jgi:tetratricopeptide (TPR) repeat protein
MALSGKGEYESALSDLSEALELDPGNAANHLLCRSDVYAQMGDQEKALVDCDEALDLKPDWPEAIERRKEIEGSPS